MKQTIKKIKISDIPEAIKSMGIDRETIINLTIETVENDLETQLREMAEDREVQAEISAINQEFLKTEVTNPPLIANAI